MKRQRWQPGNGERGVPLPAGGQAGKLKITLTNCYYCRADGNQLHIISGHKLA